MKQSNTLFFLICLISFPTFSQFEYRWLDSASAWHCTYTESFNIGYQKNTYVKDTIIDNKNCQMINRFQESKLQTGPNTFLYSGVIPLPNYYTYQSNDSVFVADNGAFYFAFKRNATIGEIWNLGEHTNFMTNSIETAFVKVDTIISNDYDGIILDDIYVYACKADGTPIENSFPSSDTLVFSKLTHVNAKFGSFGGFESFRNYFVTGIMDESLPVYLLCFESSNFDFYQFNFAQDSDCYNGIYAGISENESARFTVFPNPASIEITISNLPNASKMVLFDQQMKKNVEQEAINSEGKISLMDLKDGLYFVQILNEDGETIGFEKVLKLN